MSNHIGFFNGTGAVNNQPNESKIKLSGGKPQKDIEYFKIGFYCNGSMVDNEGDFKDKKVEVERIVGVEKGFNWVPLQNYLSQFENDVTSSETVNKLQSIAKYFFVSSDYKLVELTKDETISAYQGFHGRMPKIQTKNVFFDSDIPVKLGDQYYVWHEFEI